MDVFKKFFEIWGSFDWENKIASLYSHIMMDNFYEILRDEVHIKILFNHMSIV